MDSESDSERTDRFHKTIGVDVAKARTTQAAATRRQPAGTSRPTVKASSPQAATATIDWRAAKAEVESTILRTRGTSGGRWPAQKPVLHTGCPATTAYDVVSDQTRAGPAVPCQKTYQAKPHQPANVTNKVTTSRRSATATGTSVP